MTAACREPCCSTRRTFSVSDLFERGFRRNRALPLPVEGEPCRDADGHAARFSLAVDGGHLAAIGFRASTCATLIAYCEFLAETAAGNRIDIARAVTADDVIEAVPGVPPLKRNRAVLAVTAFRAALAAAIPTTRESNGGQDS
jgi:hypothetical protein